MLLYFVSYKLDFFSFIQLNYTRPGLPNFSPELLESWKNQVKEKGFICCTNEVKMIECVISTKFFSVLSF